MSLIYRSLKEIRGAKAPPKPGGKAVVARRDVVRVALHTVIGVVVCAIVAVLVWLALGTQVDDLAPPPQAARAVTPAAPSPAASASAPAPQAEAVPSSPAAPPQPAQPLPQAVEDLARAITAGMPAVPPADLPRPPKDPDKAQAEFFQAQARRNQRVLELERRLSVNWRWEDLSAFRQDLNALRQILGPGSELAAKWEGVEALAEKNFGLAETLFTRNQAKNPTDVSVRMNLLMALIGQGKGPEARQVFARLERMAPLDPRLKGLAAALGRMDAGRNATDQSEASAQATIEPKSGPEAQPGVDSGGGPGVGPVDSKK